MKVSHLHNLLETNVSHNPKIKKKLLIANGVIPKLTLMTSWYPLRRVFVSP